MRETGHIVKCFDEVMDDFLVSDELRKVSLPQPLPPCLSGVIFSPRCFWTLTVPTMGCSMRHRGQNSCLESSNTWLWGDLSTRCIYLPHLGCYKLAIYHTGCWLCTTQGVGYVPHSVGYIPHRVLATYHRVSATYHTGVGYVPQGTTQGVGYVPHRCRLRTTQVSATYHTGVGYVPHSVFHAMLLPFASLCTSYNLCVPLCFPLCVPSYAQPTFLHALT